MRIPVPEVIELDSLSIRRSNPEGLRGTGQKPLCIDLFCGLGGWAEGFLAEGYEVIGFDIERHRYPAYKHDSAAVKVAGLNWSGSDKPGYQAKAFNTTAQKRLRDSVPIGWREYPGKLVLQNVLTLHGSQFREATVIVASPPCQAYSYRAMPWKRAKALSPPSNELFDACFRIQREASETATMAYGCASCGIYHPATTLDGCNFTPRRIPLVVENVKGAQPWVGRAKWHYGSFYLWGDVPALMPHTFRSVKVEGFRFDGSGRSFQSASVAQKVHLSGRAWYAEGLGKVGSATSARKQASAEIAKIPFDLANHIARVYAPVQSPVSPQELMFSSQGGK